MSGDFPLDVSDRGGVPRPAPAAPEGAVQPGGGPAWGGPASAPDPSLARLLAILWRRRAIVLGLTLAGLLAGVVYGFVVTPLYRATASVRPGITAFTERGDPIRDWKLKDVTFWFNRSLYADDLRHAFGWPQDQHVPPIQAEFIARGSQNIQGGDVITLTVLDADPQRAARVLETAIGAFDAYVESDTVGTGMALTRAGLGIKIANARNEESKLDARGERLALQIAEAEKELASVAADRERYDLELKRIAHANEMRRSLLAVAEQQAREAAASRQSLEAGVQRLAKADTAAIATDPPAAAGAQGMLPWLMQSERRDEAAAAGTMAVSALALRRFEQRNLTLADSLRLELQLAENSVVDITLKRDVDLERTKAGILSKLGDLKLQQGQDIATARESLEQDIRGRRAQLAVLSPLERVGRIQVSAKPVRPRKLRAAAILTALGLCGSIGVALGWDYLTANRDLVLGRR